MSRGKRLIELFLSNRLDLLQRRTVILRVEHFLCNLRQLLPVVPIANPILNRAQDIQELWVRILVQLQDVTQFLDLEAKCMEILRVQLGPAVEFGNKIQRRVPIGPVAGDLDHCAWILSVEPLSELPGEALQGAASILSLRGYRIKKATGALHAHAAQMFEQAGHRLDRIAATMAGEGQRVADQHIRSEEHMSELQSPCNLVCRLLLEKNKNT